MSSLFHRKGSFDCELVKLPASCAPNDQAEILRAKREAKLQWMREHGVRYLGNPMRFPDRRAPGTPAALSRPVLESRVALERPGDAIVRDLASNGN
jgi:hypothetical protein